MVAAGRSATATAPPRWKLLAAFAAIYLIWGSTFFFIRQAEGALPPLLLASARLIAAGAILFAIAWMRSARPTRLHWRAALVAGAFLFLGGHGGLYLGETRVASGLAAVLLTTIPLWLTVLSRVQERRWPGRRELGGLACGGLGVFLLVGPGALLGGGRVNALGAAALVGGALAWALGSLYSRQAPHPDSPVLTAGMQMLAGGGLLLLAAVIGGEPHALRWAQVPAAAWLALAYLVVFGSIVGFSSYIWLLTVSTPARVGTYAYVNPVVAVFLGWQFASEAVTARTLLATGLILAAVALMLTYRAPLERPSEWAAGER